MESFDLIASSSLDAEVQNAMNALKKERRRLRKLEKLGRHFKRGSQSGSQRRTPNKSRSSVGASPKPSPRRSTSRLPSTLLSPSARPLSPATHLGSACDHPIDLTSPVPHKDSACLLSPSRCLSFEPNDPNQDTNFIPSSPGHDVYVYNTSIDQHQAQSKNVPFSLPTDVGVNVKTEGKLKNEPRNDNINIKKYVPKPPPLPSPPLMPFPLPTSALPVASLPISTSPLVATSLPVSSSTPVFASVGSSPASPSSVPLSSTSKRKRKEKSSRSSPPFALTDTFSFSLAPSAIVFGQHPQLTRTHKGSTSSTLAQPSVSTPASSLQTTVPEKTQNTIADTLPSKQAASSSLPFLLARTLIVAWSSVHLELWRYDHGTRVASRMFLLSCVKQQPAEVLSISSSATADLNTASTIKPPLSIAHYTQVAFGWKDASLLVAVSDVETLEGISGSVLLRLQVLDLKGRQIGYVGSVSSKVSAMCSLSANKWVVGLEKGQVNFYERTTGLWALSHHFAAKTSEAPVSIHYLPAVKSSSSVGDISRALIMFPSMCLLCSALGEILEQFCVTNDQLFCENLSVRGPYPTVLLASRISQQASEVSIQNLEDTPSNLRRSERSAVVRPSPSEDAQLKLAIANSLVETKTITDLSPSKVDSYVLRAMKLGPSPSYHIMSVVSRSSSPECMPCFASPIVCVASVASILAIGSYSSSAQPFSLVTSSHRVPGWHYASCALLNGHVLIWSARTGQLIFFMEPSTKGLTKDQNKMDFGDIENMNKVVGIGFIPLLPILCVCTADGKMRIFS